MQTITGTIKRITRYFIVLDSGYAYRPTLPGRSVGLPTYDASGKYLMAQPLPEIGTRVTLTIENVDIEGRECPFIRSIQILG